MHLEKENHYPLLKYKASHGITSKCLQMQRRDIFVKHWEELQGGHLGSSASLSCMASGLGFHVSKMRDTMALSIYRSTMNIK